MARYTRSLSVALSLSDCLTQLKAVLKDCGLEVLLSKEDCLIARETPGQVPFAKLVTIEVLVDSTRATSTITNMDVVVKNEELPLQTNNHCSQVFDQLNQSLAQHSGWQVISENLPAVTATSEPLGSQANSDKPQQTIEALSVKSQQQALNPQETASQENRKDIPSLETGDQKRVNTAASLEELRQKRAESVANLERLRQKRVESIANLEKIRQKREHILATNDAMDTAAENRNPLDLPEQPSTSQA